MNASLETLLRFVQLTSSGFLAGSLGFGQSALVPGWEDELPAEAMERERVARLFNAIGPAALASSLALVVSNRKGPSARRWLDLGSTLGLAGVLGVTLLGTVPLNRRMSNETPLDYEIERSTPPAKVYNRIHAIRRGLGAAAFLCAAAASISPRR